MNLKSFALLTAISACVAGTTSCGGSSDTALSDQIDIVTAQQRYVDAGSKWSMVVMDANSGEVLYARDPDRLSFTGSVRKLFSVGMALNALGPDHRFTTSVYRIGTAGAQGVLAGDLVLVAAGDLTFGGRAKGDGTLAFTDFDHNEAHAFGGSGLTPQDPLAALDALAKQVRAAGIERVQGDVLIDDRLFDSFRVPNGNVLISPINLNENLIDVIVTPSGTAGQPANLDWRPRVSGLAIEGGAVTGAAGSTADLMLSGNTAGDNRLTCLGIVDCKGTISDSAGAAPGTIPVGYQAPLVGGSRFVDVLKAEDPATLTRMAFIDALKRSGVTVDAPVVARNPTGRLPPAATLAAAPLVASYSSERYAEQAKLILKVSLNTGANLSLMHVGLSQGQRTVAGALGVERRLLVEDMKLDPAGFDFVTNGSGSPDSRASARTTAQLLTNMRSRPAYVAYRGGLPRLGEDGSLAEIGKTVIGKEHIQAKSGATVNAQGNMAAMTLAGYIDARSGRALSFTVFVNDAGPVTQLEDTLQVFEDEAQIAGVIYANF